MPGKDAKTAYAGLVKSTHIRTPWTYIRSNTRSRWIKASRKPQGPSPIVTLSTKSTPPQAPAARSQGTQGRLGLHGPRILLTFETQPLNHDDLHLQTCGDIPNGDHMMSFSNLKSRAWVVDVALPLALYLDSICVMGSRSSPSPTVAACCNNPMSVEVLATS